jgi:hypothetical protein
MTNPDPSFGEEQPFSREELHLASLLHQFLSLSDDQDCAGRITFRGPHGEFIGEAKLSLRDIEDATNALAELNERRQAFEEAALAATEELPEVDDSDVTAMVTALESIANGGQH